jgi:hypothetical protein
MYLTTLLSLNIIVAKAFINDCSNGKSLFSIQSLGFWPDPAIKNSNSTTSFAYTVPEPGFAGGSAIYSVTYNFIPVSPTTEDLCKSIICPIVPGVYNTSSSTTFPDLSGSLTIKIEWKGLNSEQLLCAQIKTTT